MKNLNIRIFYALAVSLFFCSVSPSVLAAGDVEFTDSLWKEANNAYIKGSWNEALDAYCLIEDTGLESPSLYTNIADAYYKSGESAMAILYYERALKLDPSYSDARYNLDLLNSRIRDRIDSVPDFILSVWAKDICYLMDSDAWAVSFIIFMALTLAMLLVFFLTPSVPGRRTGFFTAIVAFIFALSSLSFSVYQKKDYMTSDDAIVMSPVTSVKSSPSSESSQDLFILHEGSKVKILDSVGNWKNIELADGRQGWIKSEDITLI